MSFFCEATNPDLSGKTSEELDSIQKELNEKKTNINSERIKANKIVRLCDSQLKDIDYSLKLISKELTRREEIEEAKSMLNPENLDIEGFELLSEDELSIITKNMDRTDYRKHGKYPRFHDFERICKEVINKKKKYPRWTLSKLERGGQYDTLPPQIFYRYEYKDEDGNHFNIGGIKLISF
jgi:hypothetical protein